MSHRKSEHPSHGSLGLFPRNLDGCCRTNFAKEGGEKWNSVIEEAKKPYFDKAAKLKAEHENGDSDVWRTREVVMLLLPEQREAMASRQVRHVVFFLLQEF